jgi:V/A-type H+/Na+-transporting ATPase subunit I
MFKPAKMTRIRIIAHKRYSESLLSALQDVGVMQIEQLPEEALALLNNAEQDDYKNIADHAQRFRGLESLLLPHGSDKKFSFDSIEELMEKADGIKIDGRVSEIRKEMDGLDANLAEMNSKLLLLKKIDGFAADLSVLNNREIVSFAVYGQQLKELTRAVEGSSTDILATVLKDATIFSMRKSGEKDFGYIAEKYRVTVEFIPQMSGRIQETARSLQHEVTASSKRKEVLITELSSISEKYYPLVSALREQFDLEMEKVEVISRLGKSASVIAVEGWIAAASLSKLEPLIKKVTENAYVLDTIETEELPPTIMQNPVGTRLYEFFIRFYSLPKSTEIDPTIMFALAFPIFFGFMVGDFGYGLIMLLLAIFIIHRINHPPKVSRLPKAITSFISLLISRNSLKTLAKSIIPGAIIAMLLGIAFNEYFGFQLPYTALFNVQTGLAHLLVVAGWIGVFMVEFGFLLGAMNKFTEGETRHAIAKIGWMAAGAGFVIFGLNVLHQAAMGLNNPIAVASYVLLVVGIIVIAVFDGLSGLMELPSLISHMLSYTRLVGILLASVILAEVIDLIFIGGWHHSVILGLVGTIILVVGQLFNIVIAMFEPGIQGARLIYVEFFSKFFMGNGRVFRPFATQRNRTLARFKI